MLSLTNTQILKQKNIKYEYEPALKKEAEKPLRKTVADNGEKFGIHFALKAILVYAQHHTTFGTIKTVLALLTN